MSKIWITESNGNRFEYDISEPTRLRDLLYSLVNQESRVIMFEMPNVGIFTIGVGLPCGFVQYSKTGEPPYLVASANGSTESKDLDDEVEFDANGTPTPIPKRFCLPYERVVNIIIHFFINHELPQFVKWEEI